MWAGDGSPAAAPVPRLVLAGLVALALLALGEAAPAAAPVEVAIEAHGTQLSVAVDGQRHGLSSGLGGGWRGVAFESPGPLEREYQVDGSDTTATQDRQPAVVLGLLGTPLYAVDAWLRDEGSYSRWERTSLQDLSPTPGTDSGAGAGGGLPSDFRVLAALRRPEAPAHVWLLGARAGDREGLELDRDRRNARWLVDHQGEVEPLPRWFFPEQPAPFAAELLHLLGRSAAAAWALLLAALLPAQVGRAVAAHWRHGPSPAPGVTGLLAGAARMTGRVPPPGAARWAPAAGGQVVELALPVWLLGAALVATNVYHQVPHVLDAVSYTFQAGLLARGALWLGVPAVVAAFRGPFQVIWEGRWFSQYPPGAPAAYALGDLLGLGWLIGGVACAAMIGSTAWAGGALFGTGVRRLVLGLGVLSPFVLFQSGSFLSHPLAGGLLGGALAAFVAGDRAGAGSDSRKAGRWFCACGALLGAGFLTREAASLLFAAPLTARLVATRRWRGLVQLGIAGVPAVLVYLAYNAALTGSPWTLPRALFNPSDRFGFGDGVGFHTRHTLAAGLVNTDELLTLLQFDALGWPPLAMYGLAGLAFLVGRARAWDWVALGGLLAFVAAYTAYFYHGIALGPRYYFEAMPWLLLLVARGAQVMAHLARSRLAAGALVGLLSLNTLLLYLPHELARRVDFSGLPTGQTLRLGFVRSTPLGPRLAGVPSPSLVLTSDWWLYNAALAALNCSRVPDCPVVFGLAESADDEAQLRQAYPGRLLLRAVDLDGQVVLQPG